MSPKCLWNVSVCLYVCVCIIHASASVCVCAVHVPVCVRVYVCVYMYMQACMYHSPHMCMLEATLWVSVLASHRV